MFEVPEIDLQTTDGEIAVINLESTRRRSWSRFYEDSARDGVAETVIENEQLTLQLISDVFALDRVESLAAQFAQGDTASAREALVQAQVASMAHRFCDARHYLAQAESRGAPTADVDRLRRHADGAPPRSGRPLSAVAGIPPERVRAQPPL